MLNVFIVLCIKLVFLVKLPPSTLFLLEVFETGQRSVSARNFYTWKFSSPTLHISP